MKPFPFKLCANISLLFNEYILLDRFSAAADHGFKAVEIQFPYDNTLEDLQIAQAKNQTQVVLINVPVGDLMHGGEGLASHPNRRDDFKRALDQCLEYAQALSVERVNVLAGRCNEIEQREYYLDTFLENLNYAASELSQIGINTVFEAINTRDMPNFLIHNTAQMKQVLTDLNHSNLSMQYDIYHMATMGEPVIEQLKEYAPNIGHIQFADTPSRHQPGSGELHFESILEALQAARYQQWLGAEYKPSGKTQDSLQWAYDWGFLK